MKHLIFCSILATITSCEIPSRQTADFAFLEIEKATLEGRESAFADIWFFQDGQSQGVYELPRKIPVVLSDAAINVTLQPGIRENGINSSPRTFPFASNIDLNNALEKGETLFINPDFSYLDITKFRLDADFETGNPFGFDEDGVDSIGLVAEGGIGAMRLEAGQLIEEATALVYNQLPQNGSPVYLEVEYRGNRDLDIGLIGVAGDEVFKEYFVSLRSENDWKKAYVNFTDLLVASRLPGYQVLLGVDNTEGGSDVEVYVDNIKLLHF